MTNEKEPQKPESTRYKAAVIVLAVLLILSIIPLIFLWRENIKLKGELSKKVIQIDTLEVAKTNLLHELISLKEGYASLKTENATLKTEIENKKKQIDSLITIVKKGQIAAAELKKARDEIETLKKIMRHYVQVIDSLNRINQALAQENVQYKKGIEESKKKITELETKKGELESKVKIGERLKATAIQAIPGFMRKGTKFVDSKRHKKITTIKICLNIDENPLTPPGKYTLYGRVIAPDGTVLVEAEDEAHTFSFMGSHGYYSFKREIEYNNIAITDYCIYYEPNVNFLEGQYVVELYINDYQIGKTTFELK